MLGRVVGRDHDGATSLPASTAEGEGVVVADVGDRPPVAVADPATPGAQAPVVVSGDDGVPGGGALAGEELDLEVVNTIAAALEGHPDNSSASVFGGATLSTPVANLLRKIPFIDQWATRRRSSA